MILKFQGAKRMSNPFDGIAESMRKIIHRVYTPGIPGSLVAMMSNTVNYRIAQIDIWRGHVNFRPQDMFPIPKLTCPHLREQLSVFINVAIAIGAIGSGFCQGAAMLSNFFRIKAIHVSQALFDQFNRKTMELIEVVRGMGDAGPLVPQPVYVFLDSRDSVWGQSKEFFADLGVALEITPEAVHRIAREAFANRRIGARALKTIYSQVIKPFEFEPYDHPEMRVESDIRHLLIDKDLVVAQLEGTDRIG